LLGDLRRQGYTAADLFQACWFCGWHPSISIHQFGAIMSLGQASSFCRLCDPLLG
jgi:hypothetical protein